MSKPFIAAAGFAAGVVIGVITPLWMLLLVILIAGGLGYMALRAGEATSEGAE